MPTQTLLIPTPDGEADAYAAFPDHPAPGVLLYSDAFGIRPELEARARELAGRGYYVLVPHLYYRHGPAPVAELPAHIGEDVRPAVIDQVLPFVRELTPELIQRDADAYLGFLATHTGPGPAAVIGYCIGGALALRTAAAFPERVGAIAGFHPGFLVTDEPASPHRLLSALTAEVHFGLSGNDMSPEAVVELDQALEATGVGYTIETYPGTVHGFTMSDTDAFSPAGSQLHWERLLALLARTLGSPA